ncbi:hypothetical protein P344_00785 [Spiroplasma mirum ATCC 29335]|uniref:Uncharacterized protein n=1 Tax=Spiroplasma mirum ATCC 29335 TaxID=838561 RepID=W0GPZ4_9MOLU|nr:MULTISPECIES: hypothetical protein [Spiroplasma]AHF60596.1 hypothetical protein SMM_0129 [Spiroplasma mirum ATCC 29335]AHI57530.1 hypothetical protein P344_00785 [Spiroplasma mirum ATCC 29335]AKM52714.1 hypothetical protein SATRI_v1c01370 [Spiroplasma atrichopogonis]
MKKLLSLFSALVFTTIGVNNVFDNDRIEKTANKIKELYVLGDSFSDVGVLTGAVSSFFSWPQGFNCQQITVRGSFL